jgi:RNase P/RNase MRP subunit POP5
MTPAERTRPRPSQRTRLRYVAFSLHRDGKPVQVRRHVLIKAVQDAATAQGLLDSEPWLTRFDGHHGILRFRRGREDAAQAILSSLPPILIDGEAATISGTTLLTGGTIASLERKAFKGLRLKE